MTTARTPAITSEVIAIRPGPPLSGAVTVDGSKNAALPLLAAAASLRRPVQLTNVPANDDVQAMLMLLQHAGHGATCKVDKPHTVLVQPSDGMHIAPELHETAARIRASYYLVPALLAVHGRAVLPWPGGCRIGERGMEQHFKVYEAFGDRALVNDHGYSVEAGESRTGSVSVMLPYRSRGASIAALLRAVVAKRPLRLGQPNLSPEVLSVLQALQVAGWEIRADERVLSLAPPASASQEPVTWAVPGDKVEAGTLACAIAATRGNGHIEGVRSKDVAPMVAALRWLGIPVDAQQDILIVHAERTRPTHQPLRAIASLSPGGLDADFEPALMALALGMPGTHLFADAINPGRHSNLIPQLARLGADIHETSPTQCRLTGPQQLIGTGVEATDIRTGSALLIAGLTAHGVTTLGGLEQLRRGHADLPTKLLALGADICEVTP
ncbi:UDP-N-acetylglucosamine 1-carboxyvinyltransferase [Streptomyces sp. KS_16]|nr:UDP-N-acetylglucosamine 1-carboxyvinyltransferase [Streptomyces sp. KS_16]PBC84290.1 UDP-N-acetylglucosamine 1-carboxyvinyltransferase [Streptomyces sp. 2321.6]SDR32760.1 UDP-N-acetylglucosamine 1-carboxyvinyltransferase [Streptomyces sp. KS_16]SED26219.1 UDP-N-acetylglucosamine 1-carboxyvinyltransferase [Streptomyces sp. 2133.1]SNC70372.1 UDP-N-acetylglucosamine 1-carboxyvinyltransferase [Streptomyces sp. 2114.4]